MIVLISDFPRRVVRNRLPADMGEWWDAHSRKLTGWRYEIEAPAVFWWRVQQILLDHAVGPRGGYSKEAKAKNLVVALNVVTKALNARLYHPSMFGHGVAGHVTEEIPAWQWDEPGERLWTPFPMAKGEMFVLRPVHDKAKGLRITTWRPTSPNPQRVLEQESQHLVFGVDVRF